ncbi:MAG: NAD-dependent epimerase/dehydratase family protein [Bacilli bacterium]|nr:NAD-dependent epimerase/dehydratase family protein [Bacilli bacterium]
MKVLITGSNGFIGKNLKTHLQEKDNIEIIDYDKEDTFDKIENAIDEIDFIFHLAGVNRPQTPEEFYEGNSDLTKKIVDLIKDKNIPLVVTSTIHADKDTDYGKSKKIAEEYIKDNLKNYYIYRLHNVFGKWCRPNYNSVVATFCHNIANDLEITINDESTALDLIYIDDICYEFENILAGQKPGEKAKGICYINPRYNVTLGYIAKRLYEFKDSMNSIYVPNTGDDFTKKLYSTYISYLPMEKTYCSATKNVDERGSFTELVRTNECGQFSVSFSKPGIVRGNHYHHTKLERFIVIKGKAKIGFKSVVDGSYYEFIVDDSDIKVVTIPVGYTHNIENIGDDEMILAIWCNELFDKEKPDTYFKPVSE